MENDFDKLHKQIGADKLNKEEQKELFNKFIDHGGKVIKPSTKKTTVSPKDRNVIDNKQKKQKIKLDKLTEVYDDKKSIKDYKNGKSKKSVVIHKGFFDRLALYLASTSAGVKTIFGAKFKRKFINEQKILLIPELHYLANIINYLLNPNKIKYRTFVATMIKKNLYLYELLQLSTSLSNNEDLDLLSKKITEYNDIGHIDFVAIEEPIKKIYRRLYLFIQYYNDIINAVDLALNIKKELKVIDNETYESYLYKSKKAIDTIYNNCFHKLHYAVSNIFKEHLYTQEQTRIYDLLHIQEEEIVEYRIKQAIKKRKKSEDSYSKNIEPIPTDKTKENKKELLAEYLQKGKEWIDKLDYENIEYKENIPHFNKNDKIFRVYIIIEEFERELSFILTSNKIRFNIDMLDGKKVDPKKEFNDLYLGINSCHDLIKDYVNILKEVNNIETNSNLTTYKKNEMLRTFEGNQTRISNVIRVRLIDITTKLERILLWTSSSDSVIQNDNEKLYFDTIDGEKRLEEVTTNQALNYCYSFIAYFRYLLTEGELYGSLPQIP